MTLTPKQHAVAVLVAEGMTNGEISARLGIAEGTAKLHVERAIEAVGVPNRAALAAYIVRQQVVQGRPRRRRVQPEQDTLGLEVA